MKMFDYLLAGLIVLATLGALTILTRNEIGTERGIACPMDALMCPDGTAVGRTSPDCEFEPCPEKTMDDVQTHIDSKTNLIVVNTPKRDSIISSPLTITGNARGFWFFEGSFPISIVNWDGLIIGEGIAVAQGEWMTENFVPFEASINFTLDPTTPYRRGTLILKKDNPSGLPEHDDALEVPIRF